MEFFRRKHLLKALLIAPLAVLPATIVAMILTTLHDAAFEAGEWPRLNDISDAIGLVVLVSAIGVRYSYMAILVLALPAYFILGKLNSLNIYSLCAVALIPAVVSAFQTGAVDFVLFIAYFSLWVAVTFWWLAPIKP